MSYQHIITLAKPAVGNRAGKPCIRKIRIGLYDVLGWLAAGMSQAEIIDDFPELTSADITACLEFVADRECRLVAVKENIKLCCMLDKLNSLTIIQIKTVKHYKKWVVIPHIFYLN